MKIVKFEFIEDGAKIRYTYDDSSIVVENVVTNPNITRAEPTQADRIEASLDYLVLLNS